MEWKYTNTPLAYPQAISWMERYGRAVHEKKAPEIVWLLEHAPVYTLGPTGKMPPTPTSIPVYTTHRGGKITYHGPGQRIIYVVLNLKERNLSVLAYLTNLCGWIEHTVSVYLKTLPPHRPTGIWVEGPPIKKIASIGISVKNGISLHGAALNVRPCLDCFRRIVPCGLPGDAITSFHDCGANVSLQEIDQQLKKTFHLYF